MYTMKKIRPPFLTTQSNTNTPLSIKITHSPKATQGTSAISIHGKDNQSQIPTTKTINRK